MAPLILQTNGPRRAGIKLQRADVDVQKNGDRFEVDRVLAGTSAELESDRRAARAERMRKSADRMDERAAAWRKGAIGESLLASASAELAAVGFHRLDDRAIEGSKANIDHLFIGPPGLFVVDAKNWAGSVRVTGSRLMRNNRSGVAEVEKLRLTAAHVGELLDVASLRLRPPVIPVMCFVGEAQLDEGPGVVGKDRVAFVNLERFAGFLGDRPPVMDPRSIEATLSWMIERFPARSENAIPLPAADGPTPDERVLFLTPWTRKGLRRLYVRDDRGAQIGFLDLVTGRMTSEASGSEALLSRLMAAFAENDSDELLSPKARSVLRRFIDSLIGKKAAPADPLIVVRVWKKFSVIKLYVHRLESDGRKVQLGSIDVTTRTAKGPEEHWKLFTYCAERYEDGRARTAS